MPRDALNVLVRAVLTLALLAYGFLVRHADPTMGPLIIGAVVGYWLRTGETVARRRIGQRGRRADEPTTTADDR